MKSLLLVVILAVAAAAAEIDENVPEVAQEVMAPEMIEITVEDMASSNRASNRLFLGSWNDAHRQVVGETVTRNAVAGHAHDVQVTFSGHSGMRFGLIDVREWLAPQGATVALVSGGINTNRVVLRMRSQPGRGFNFLVEIFERL